MILLFGDEIEDLPPNKRPVNTVFQQYALFPHMTVAGKRRFGMLRLKVPKAEARERTMATLALVKLDPLAERRPSQLSGGQQQRVALARAMAPSAQGPVARRAAFRPRPQAPSGHAGRAQAAPAGDRHHLRLRHPRSGRSAHHVGPHRGDVRAGEIQQIGTAHEIYEKPDNRFVADFIGETNLLDVTIKAEGGRLVYDAASARQGTVIEAAAAGPAMPTGEQRPCLDQAGTHQPSRPGTSNEAAGPAWPGGACGLFGDGHAASGAPRRRDADHGAHAKRPSRLRRSRSPATAPPSPSIRALRASWRTDDGRRAPLGGGRSRIGHLSVRCTAGCSCRPGW